MPDSPTLGEHGPIVFISHAHQDGVLAAEVKTILTLLGFSGFIAHVDIAPTRVWEDEIFRNLRACVAMVVLTSANAQNSLWVNQEIGFAVAANTPTVAIKRDLDPWGMLARFQAMPWREPDTARHFDYKHALKANHNALFKAIVNLGIATKERLISGLDWATSFDEAGIAAGTLASAGKLTNPELEHLAKVCLANGQVRGSLSANGPLTAILNASSAQLPSELRAKLIAHGWKIV